MDTDRKPWPAGRGTTLNNLKGARYSLNMRLLFAMQIHDAEIQAALAEEIREIDEEIARMTSNRGMADHLRF